eukprot:182058_1
MFQAHLLFSKLRSVGKSSSSVYIIRNRWSEFRTFHSSIYEMFSKNLIDARKQSDAEVINQVDRENNIIGSVSRSEMRQKNLFHQATYIFVMNHKRELYVQKRTPNKDYCPGFYDVTAGGVLQSGEIYEQNAYRELSEEYGIKGVKLEHHQTFLFEDERVNCFGDIWSCCYDGDITPQPEEVESVEMMSISEVFRRSENGEKFCPDSIYALKLLAEPSKEFTCE